MRDLRAGEESAPDLLEAIKKGSSFPFSLKSREYVSSRKCLEEVARTDECREERKQMIFAIFYHAPSLRRQSGPYAKAFSQHEKHYDCETIQG